MADLTIDKLTRLTDEQSLKLKELYQAEVPHMICRGVLKWLRKKGNTVAYDMLTGKQSWLYDDMVSACTMAIAKHIDVIKMQAVDYQTKRIKRTISDNGVIGVILEDITKAGYRLQYDDLSWYIHEFTTRYPISDNKVKKAITSDKHKVLYNGNELSEYDPTILASDCVIMDYYSPAMRDIMTSAEQVVQAERRKAEKLQQVEYYDHDGVMTMVMDNLDGWQGVSNLDVILENSNIKELLPMLSEWEQSMVVNLCGGHSVLSWHKAYSKVNDICPTYMTACRHLKGSISDKYHAIADKDITTTIHKDIARHDYFWDIIAEDSKHHSKLTPVKLH